MIQQHPPSRLWRWGLILGAAGLLLSAHALAQVTPPAALVPLQKFSIAGKTSASETADTRSADYTVTFTLAPDKVLDPSQAALRLRLETAADAPELCAVVGIPQNCLFPDAKGSTRCPTTARCR